MRMLISLLVLAMTTIGLPGLHATEARRRRSAVRAPSVASRRAARRSASRPRKATKTEKKTDKKPKKNERGFEL